MTCVLNPLPSGVTNAKPPVAPGVKVNMLLAAGVTRVHAPVPLCAPNQTGTRLGSQLAKLIDTLLLPPADAVTRTARVVLRCNPFPVAVTVMG
jgi:hypothetical protein